MVDRADGSAQDSADVTGEEPRTPAAAPCSAADSSRTTDSSRSVDHSPSPEMSLSVDHVVPARTSAALVPAAVLTSVPDATADDESDDHVPARVGCRTDLRGWAGAHLHGAVRPRRRAAGRGRPPGRWC